MCVNPPFGDPVESSCPRCHVIKQLRLHPSLPVFRGAPQTSLSFICQQQPVIRIPLPAGPPTHRKADVARRGSRQTDVPAVPPRWKRRSPSLRWRWSPWRVRTQTVPAAAARARRPNADETHASGCIPSAGTLCSCGLKIHRVLSTQRCLWISGCCLKRGGGR